MGKLILKWIGSPKYGLRNPTHRVFIGSVSSSIHLRRNVLSALWEFGDRRWSNSFANQGQNQKRIPHSTPFHQIEAGLILVFEAWRTQTIRNSIGNRYIFQIHAPAPLFGIGMTYKLSPAALTSHSSRLFFNIEH